jgi:predicted Zn-ribbon and HTH transcriptional regulator
MDQYPGKKRSNRPAAIALATVALLGVGGCGQKIDGRALATPTTSAELLTTPPPSTAAATTPKENKEKNKESCADLNEFSEVTALDGTNRRLVVDPADCRGKTISVYNEQGQTTGQLPDKSEFDIICSAADTVVNPTLRIHSDNPPLDGRVHLGSHLAAQEVTDYSLPNC